MTDDRLDPRAGAGLSFTPGGCKPVGSCISWSRAGGPRARPPDAVPRSCLKTLGRFIFPDGPLRNLVGGEACPVETGLCTGEVLGGAARHRLFLEVLPGARGSFPEDEFLFLRVLVRWWLGCFKQVEGAAETSHSAPCLYCFCPERVTAER